MTFDEVLDQVRELLQQRGRVTYRALKRRFDLDDEYLEDLKGELIRAEGVAADEDGDVLVWRGAAPVAPGRPEELHLQCRVAGRCYHHPALSERSVRLSPHCAQAFQTFREECGFATDIPWRCTC